MGKSRQTAQQRMPPKRCSNFCSVFPSFRDSLRRFLSGSRKSSIFSRSSRIGVADGACSETLLDDAASLFGSAILIVLIFPPNEREKCADVKRRPRNNLLDRDNTDPILVRNVMKSVDVLFKVKSQHMWKFSWHSTILRIIFSKIENLAVNRTTNLVVSRREPAKKNDIDRLFLWDCYHLSLLRLLSNMIFRNLTFDLFIIKWEFNSILGLLHILRMWI